MRKKLALTIFTIVTAIAMLAGGTMAWFTAQSQTEVTAFTSGTVKIQAGQIVDFSETEEGDYEWVSGEIFPKRVVGSRQGKAGINQDKTVKPARSNPTAVLAFEDTKQDEDFFSLGFGGYVVVEFDSYIYPGKDESLQIATVVEDTHGKPYPLEAAEVSLSHNGEDWIKLADIATNDQPGYKNQIVNEIEIPADLALEYARYIKVQDITDPAGFADMPQNSDTVDGFDVNAIYVAGAYQSADFNWNPGDKTVKEYYVINEGTKKINLRGEFDLQWYRYNEDKNKWVEWTEPEGSVVTLQTADSDWYYEDGYYYYDGVVPGTYDEDDEDARTVLIPLSIETEGSEMGNEYQGKRFILNGSFEAIQASNGAAEAVWEESPGE